MSVDLRPVGFYKAEPEDAPIVAWMVAALPSGVTRRVGFTAQATSLLAVSVVARVHQFVVEDAQ